MKSPKIPDLKAKYKRNPKKGYNTQTALAGMSHILYMRVVGNNIVLILVKHWRNNMGGI